MQFSPRQEEEKDDWIKYLKMNRIKKTDILESWDRKNLLSFDDKEMCKLFMKEVIDEKLIPTVAAKIRQYEHHIKNTKKGFTNIMKGFLGKKERSENDGLRKDFVMNNQEVYMKNLIDLSFLFQDYRTYGAHLKYPMSDFKSIKAYKQVSS
jgi:hypothetical protein